MARLSTRSAWLLQSLLVLAFAAAPAQSQGLCFRGAIRPGCSGFVLFEASAEISRGGTHTFVPPSSPGYTARSLTYDDMPSYVSGAVGCLRVRHPRTAIGGVAEWAFPDGGIPSRVTFTARWRRQFTEASWDVGAGLLSIGLVDQGGPPVGPPTARAYGVTVESAIMLRGYVGVTGGLDLVHGLGRTSPAVHAGVRSGSYATIVAGVASAVFTFIALASIAGDDG